jgi:hypothetical protein
MINENEANEIVTEEENTIIDNIEKQKETLDNIIDDNEDNSDHITNEIEKSKEEEYLDSLDNKSVIELVSIKRKAEINIKEYTEAKNIIDGISHLNLEDDVNRNLMKSNILTEKGFNDELKSFNENYPERIEFLNNIISKVDNIINNYGDDINQASFLTKEMLRSLDQKLERFNKEDLNYDLTIRKFNTVRYAFSNRTEITYLTNKADSFIKNKKNVKSYRKFKNSVNFRKTIYKDIYKVFNEDIINRFITYLKEYYKDDDIGLTLFIVFISKIIENEKDKGYDAWIKVLILNISDIKNNAFDLIDNPDDYINDIENNVLKKFKLDL